MAMYPASHQITGYPLIDVLLMAGREAALACECGEEFDEAI
jgi:hypothetical protein